MPKVSQSYIDNKKTKIIDAAFNVCKRKTVCTVTMQDIIDESGLSQGGIYNFFNNIDEILAAVLDKIRKEESIDDLVDELVKKHESIEESTRSIFILMAESMKKDLNPYYKIEFEYNILTTNFPERAKRIYTMNKIPFMYKRFFDVLVPIIKKLIDEKSISPKVNLEDVFEYNSATFDGILKQAIYYYSYQKNIMQNKSFFYNIDKQFKMMYLSTCNFLGIVPLDYTINK